MVEPVKYRGMNFKFTGTLYSTDSSKPVVVKFDLRETGQCHAYVTVYEEEVGYACHADRDKAIDRALRAAEIEIGKQVRSLARSQKTLQKIRACKQ